MLPFVPASYTGLIIQPNRRNIMNASKFVIAAVLAATSFASMAATVDKTMPQVVVSAPDQGVNSGDGYMGYTGFVSTKTRAEVIQELHDAQRRGEIYSGEAYPGPLLTQTNKTRAEVLAELDTFRMTHAQVSDDGAFAF
jgi:hypothetical protein